MPNTSATAKLVTQLSSQALYGDDLARYLQQWTAGLIGIDSELVRPRWQGEPPNIPPEGTDWCAIGVVEYEEVFGRTVIDQTDTNNRLVGYEVLTILSSFYGPKSDYYAALFGENTLQPQNKEQFKKVGMAVVGIGKKTNTNELIKQRWMKRVDYRFRVNRVIDNTYPIMAIDSVGIDVAFRADNASSRPLEKPNAYKRLFTAKSKILSFTQHVQIITSNTLSVSNDVMQPIAVNQNVVVQNSLFVSNDVMQPISNSTQIEVIDEMPAPTNILSQTNFQIDSCGPSYWNLNTVYSYLGSQNTMLLGVQYQNRFEFQTAVFTFEFFNEDIGNAVTVSINGTSATSDPVVGTGIISVTLVMPSSIPILESYNVEFSLDSASSAEWHITSMIIS